MFSADKKLFNDSVQTKKKQSSDPVVLHEENTIHFHWIFKLGIFMLITGCRYLKNRNDTLGDKNAAEAATVQFGHLCTSRLVFSLTPVNLNMNIVPERSLLPAPSLPLHL